MAASGTSRQGGVATYVKQADLVHDLMDLMPSAIFRTHRGLYPRGREGGFVVVTENGGEDNRCSSSGVQHEQIVIPVTESHPTTVPVALAVSLTAGIV